MFKRVFAQCPLPFSVNGCQWGSRALSGAGCLSFAQQKIFWGSRFRNGKLFGGTKESQSDFSILIGILHPLFSLKILSFTGKALFSFLVKRLFIFSPPLNILSARLTVYKTILNNNEVLSHFIKMMWAKS